jgi:anti-sigma regulatory factor (Ser/Thr protein kinase)
MHSTEISALACYEALPQLLAEITRQAETLGTAVDVLQRLQLIVEEIFLNSVTHGYGGDSENTVQLSIRCKDDLLTLHYEDGAPPFDISQAVTQIATATGIGGLGIGLIHGLCKAMRYQRQGSRNISEFDL